MIMAKAMLTNMARASGSCSIDPRVRIGHVHLKVANIERSLAFYRDLLGLQLTGRAGDDAAFLSAGSYHHHLAINAWESRGGSAPPRGTTGLYHVAFLYPDRAALGDALRRLNAAGASIEAAHDHGVGEAIYLRDPDGNGIELCWDRPESEWPRHADGSLKLVAMPLALDDLAAEEAPSGGRRRVGGSAPPIDNKATALGD
jgi:catechol 2,3-dioxygenase